MTVEQTRGPGQEPGADHETGIGAEEGVEPPRRAGANVGTVTAGLLLLLGVALLALLVVPMPRGDMWLVGVAAVLGLALVLVVQALLPRGERDESSPS